MHTEVPPTLIRIGLNKKILPVPAVPVFRVAGDPPQPFAGHPQTLAPGADSPRFQGRIRIAAEAPSSRLEVEPLQDHDSPIYAFFNERLCAGDLNNICRFVLQSKSNRPYLQVIVLSRLRSPNQSACLCLNSSVRRWRPGPSWEGNLQQRIPNSVSGAGTKPACKCCGGREFLRFSLLSIRRTFLPVDRCLSEPLRATLECQVRKTLLAHRRIHGLAVAYRRRYIVMDLAEVKLSSPEMSDHEGVRRPRQNLGRRIS